MILSAYKVNRAKRDHFCDQCNGMIYHDSSYYRAFGDWHENRKPFTLKLHLHCATQQTKDLAADIARNKALKKKPPFEKCILFLVPKPILLPTLKDCHEFITRDKEQDGFYHFSTGSIENAYVFCNENEIIDAENDFITYEVFKNPLLKQYSFVKWPINLITLNPAW